MSARFRFAPSCLLAVSLAVVSCGPDKTGVSADAGVPDASKEPIVGGKLGDALASAAAAANSGAPIARDKPKNGEQAPPETGIFEAGEADKRQPKGAPPKIELLSEGAEPRVQLAHKVDAPEQKTTVSVAMRMGQGRLPTIEFSLSIKPEVAKGEKTRAAPAEKPKDAPAEKPADAAEAAAPVRLAATVTGTALPSMQGIPKELAEAIAKLKGSVVRYDFSADGGASNHVVELPKGAGEELGLVIDALVDTISMLTVVVPAKPVGKDGYWIVSDRAKTAAGIEVVRFRVFKVTKVESGAVTLSLDIRQYSADQKLRLDAGGGQKAEMGMEAFDSQGKGNVVWKADGFLPIRGDMTERVGVKLQAPPGTPPGGRGAPMVQTELTGLIGGGTSVPDEKP